MNLYDNTADALRYGALVSVIIIAIGLIADNAGISYGENVLWFGVLVLILSPLFGILVSMAALAAQREWQWVTVSAILLAVVTAGILIAWIF